MPNTTIFENLGLKEYQEVWTYQETLFNQAIDTKLYNREHPQSLKDVNHYLLFVEHPHVYTLGKSGTPNNLLINEQFLKQINATFYKSNRGGSYNFV